MIKRCANLGAAALVVLGLHAGPAQALTYDRVPPLEEIASRATLAFRGVVRAVEFAQASAGNGALVPYTITTFVVREPYAGCRRGEQLQIMQMGGPTADRPTVHLIIPGAPDYSVGEEVVVFSNDGEQPFFGAYFGDHGVLRVARDQAGVRRILDEKWRPLMRTDEGLTVDGAQRCQVDRGRRERCSLTAGSTESALLGVAELDAMLHGAAAKNLSGKRAQLVSNDRARFEAALGAFARQDVAEMQRVLRREN
jgi:hypothetical protein